MFEVSKHSGARPLGSSHVRLTVIKDWEMALLRMLCHYSNHGMVGIEIAPPRF
jgi:hypothetical protein